MIMNMVYRKSANELPYGFQRVEYIETSGTQYIKTNIKPAEVDEVEAVLTRTGTSGQQYFIGTRTVGNDTALGYSIYFTAHGGNIYYPLVWNGTGSDIEIDTEFSTLTEFKNGTDKFYLNGTLLNSHKYDESRYLEGTNIFIGCTINNASSQSPQYLCTAKFHRIVFRKNGIEVANFIPCYRTLDDEIGLYDVVQGVFYTNNGTGVFAKGSDVN